MSIDLETSEIQEDLLDDVIDQIEVSRRTKFLRTQRMLEDISCDFFDVAFIPCVLVSACKYHLNILSLSISVSLFRLSFPSLKFIIFFQTI